MTPQELGGLVQHLTPAIQNTGATIGETTQLINQADLLTRCFDHNIVPTGNEVIADPPIGTGQPVYRELFQSAVGIAIRLAELRRQRPVHPRQRRRRRDARAPARRCRAPGRSTATLSCRRSGIASRVRRQPATAPAQRRLLQEREAEPQPRLHGAGLVKRAIRVHRQDFIAILALVVAAVAVAVYILEHQPSFGFGQELLHGQGPVRERRRGDGRTGAVGRRRGRPGRSGRRGRPARAGARS